MLELYNHLEKRVLELDDRVSIKFTKSYIAFKLQTNFVYLHPQKSGLLLNLDIQFASIRDPKGICKSVSDTGTGWDGAYPRVHLKNLSELDYMMELIEQALKVQLQVE